MDVDTTGSESGETCGEGCSCGFVGTRVSTLSTEFPQLQPTVFLPTSRHVRLTSHPSYGF